MSSPLSATLLVVGDPTITGGGPFTWTYDLFLQDGSQLAPSAAPCSNVPAGANCNGLFTIYDFAGYVAGTDFAPAGWTFLGAFLTGETPIGISPGANISTVDNPGVTNLSWAYTDAATLDAVGADVLLGAFGADSLYSNSTFTEYTARSRRIVGGVSTRSINLEVSIAPAAVPEPGSVFLMGSAILGLAFFVRRRRV